MRVCGFDLETTGLDFDKDRVTEMAWAVKDISDPKFLKVRSTFVLDNYFPPTISEEIKGITKIDVHHLQWGCSLEDAFKEMLDDYVMFKCDAFVAHYGHNFDKPFLLAKIRQQYPIEQYAEETLIFSDSPLIDTRDDIEYPQTFKSRSLTHVAAELGFLNPFPHSALFDVATMLRVLECFDVEKVFARSKEPWVTLRAVVSYDEKDLAKERRYRWEDLGDKKYPKFWVKRVKLSEVEKEKQAPFQVTVLEDTP